VALHLRPYDAVLATETDMTVQIFILALTATILVVSILGTTWKTPAVLLGVVMTFAFELGWVLDLVI